MISDRVVWELWDFVMAIRARNQLKYCSAAPGHRKPGRLPWEVLFIQVEPDRRVHVGRMMDFKVGDKTNRLPT